MPAVLLRSSRLNALVADAELDPPDAELGETAERLRGERIAVVGTHSLRQAVLLEEALEDWEGALLLH